MTFVALYYSLQLILILMKTHQMDNQISMMVARRTNGLQIFSLTLKIGLEIEGTNKLIQNLMSKKGG